MKDKRTSVLFLAAICLAGIALAIAQPATYDIYIDTNYTETYNTGIRVDNATMEKIGLNQPLIINGTYLIKYRVVNNGTEPEDVNITVRVSNETEWSVEFGDNTSIGQNQSYGGGGDIAWDTTGLAPGNYALMVNASILVDDDWSNNEGKRDVVLETPTIPAPALTSPFPVSFVIYGYVTYANGTRVLNPTVRITNLNTTELFTTVKTHNESNYYRLRTDSTHINVSDTIRFNASDGENYCIEIDHTITEEEIKNGGFRQDLPGMPDLVITGCGLTWIDRENNTYNFTYSVENIGTGNAGVSIASLWVDGILKGNDSVKPLELGENYTNTFGPFNFPCRDIKVCADSGNAVDEYNETNNCLETGSGYPLPNLRIGEYGGQPHYLWRWVDWPNGKFKIHYSVSNQFGKAPVGPSNTTINVTNVVINGSVSTISIVDQFDSPPPPFPPLASSVRSLEETFTCLCNHTTTVEVCLDGDNAIFESVESDNYWTENISCPPSACMPDLKLVNSSKEWIDQANRTFNVTYTVQNVGNVDANASTTRVYLNWDDPQSIIFEINDSVPALAPGESYTSTVEPFWLSCPPKHWPTSISIHADCYGKVTESNEDNNRCGFKFGSYLQFYPGRTGLKGKWDDWGNWTYVYCYTIYNEQGSAISEPGKVRAYIDGNTTASAEDDVPSLPPNSGCSGQDYAGTLGPLKMTGKNDTIRVCIEWEGCEICRSEKFGHVGCVAFDNSTAFMCGEPVTQSCRLVGDMYCSDPYYGMTNTSGLKIRSDNIIIDGNGHAIIGDRSVCSEYFTECEGYIPYAGIANRMPGDENPGYKNVTIKNLEVMDFCIGISITNGADNNSIENCWIHDNGATVQYNYGIHVENSNYTTIDGCRVYNNTGMPPTLNVGGGHGINFHDYCNYCEVTNSSIFNNYLSGIYASPTCKELYIANNTIEENGYCGESGFCTGVNLHWRGGFGVTTNSTVENNLILNNTGSGIYVAQGYTTIKDNIVKGSKNGTDVTVTGNGIVIEGGMVTFLHNNTCCENEGTDVVNSESSFATYGDDNTCDTISNYDDEGTRGCNFYCGGENGACVGATRNFRCGDVVTESCTFNRSISCRGSDGDGLIVGSDNITIDGAGYALTGNFSGIGIFSNRSGVVIKNLQVEDFATGMKIENVSENVIENCTVRTNLLTGINFSADNGTVRNSRIYDNAGPGMLIRGSNNTFENNTVAKSKNGTLIGYGIYFSPDAKNNNLTENAIGDNEAMDIYNDDGPTNVGNNNTCDVTHNYNDTGMTDYGCTYPWTPPDLIISDKFEEWVEKKDAHYNVTYTIENIGVPKSRPVGPSTTYMYIFEPRAATDRVEEPLKPGENYTSTFNLTPKIPEERDSDRINVCADGADVVQENNEANKFYYNDVVFENYYLKELFEFEDKEANNCLENEFSKSKSGEEDDIRSRVACVCEDGWCDDVGREYYKCGDRVVESCTFKNCSFTGSMSCKGGHGLIIGKNGITIDGAENAIGGTREASCVGVRDQEKYPGAVECGIYNRGYDYVTIKNLKIKYFCNGIGLHGTVSDHVVGNTIENCEICYNGNSAGGKSHGIHMVGVEHTTIKKDNDIHHNHGTGGGCGDGGNGIFLLAGYITNANNTIVGNKLHHNDRAGFWTKAGMNGCTIKNNEIWHNSYGSGLGSATGGLVLQCLQSDHNTIEHNEVSDNSGRGGIFIGGNHNTLTGNNVHDNKGDGIYIGRCYGGGTNNKLINNTFVCKNEGVDIKTCGDEASGKDYKNTGEGNFCDTTKYYKDDDAAEGCKCWQLCSNASKPDLEIVNKKEEWVVEGSTYNVTYTVKNVGKADAPTSITSIRIADLGEELDPVKALAPNESYTSTVGRFIMSGRISDTITVCADYDGQKVEKLGSESRTSTPNSMENTWTALPDLTVTEIEVPDKLSLLKSNIIIAEIENIGNVRAGKPFKVTLFENKIKKDEVPVDDLARLSSEEVELEWSPFPSDSHRLTVVVDTGNDVIESNEDNNEKTITITEKKVDDDGKSNRIGGGGGPPAGKENVTGYEPGPGGGTGEFGADIGGEQLPVNESETVSGGETRKSGHPFGMGGEIIETVKVVAPVFLIIMIVIVIALFYSGYFGEKRAHRRKNNRKNG